MSPAWKLEAEAPVGRGVLAKRFRLDNGLGLIVSVDRSAPIVSIHVWYRVGSKHERPGATGMAHLFEHLMFRQTEHLAPGEYDRVVERIGGESNAGTWVDWTYYKLSLPARDLALGLSLEADRMQHLVLEPETVETERDVVTNERREYVEDDVDGWLGEQLMAQAFTVHPYRWPTIGWMEDIRALSLPDIRAFYRSWYRPNNATIVCVGDIDEQALLDLVAKHYGSIAPSGRESSAAIVSAATGEVSPVEPEQTRERVVRAGKPIATDRLLVGYKAPGQDHPDWAVLEIVATLLAGCPSARLHRRLVIEREAASSCDAQLTPFADPSLFRIVVTAARGHKADDILQLIDAEIAGLVEHAPKAAEVEKAKSLVETDFWSSLVDVDGKAYQLGHYETTLGDFRKVNAIAERLAAVTVDDVTRVVQTYLRPERRTIVIATPEGSTDDDADDDDDDDDGADDEAQS